MLQNPLFEIEKSKISSILKKLMKNKENISPAELARRTNTPTSTLHKLLSGDTVDPRCSTLLQLAQFFNVSISQMIGIEPLETTNRTHYEQHSIPIISWKECIHYKTITSELKHNNQKESIFIDKKILHGYALISRISMEPRFPRGTILIVDPNLEPTDGNIVVTYFLGTSEATIRQFTSDGRIKYLTPLNIELPEEKYDDETVFLGTVIQSKFVFT